MPVLSVPAPSAWHEHSVVRCRRKIGKFAPTFEILDAKEKQPLLFCQEKVLSIKDDIRVYSDASKWVELIRIKQENVFEYQGTFEVIDATDGRKIGGWQRTGAVPAEWLMLEPNQDQVGRIIETGGTFWRRMLGFLPWTFAFELHGTQVGTFIQDLPIVTYTATMDISGWSIDAPGHGKPSPDRRMAFAGALLLMAVEAHIHAG